MRLEFTFPVGSDEQHMVQVSYDQFWGCLTLRVDGTRVLREWLDLNPYWKPKDYRLRVGHLEQHDVLIRKVKQQRPLAGFLPQTFQVLIDGELVVTHDTS